jgi:hypothetical protein
MIDFYNDPGHATLRHLLQRSPGAAEMLKTAELEDFNRDLPDSAFAWQSKRLYPVHTPEHAAVSYLYAKHASARTPREVLTFIKEALDIYGVEEEALAEVQIKEAALDEDECLFPQSRTYPVRDADEVKTAEEKLLAQAAKLRPETRADAFTRLAKAASFHGVNLREDSYKYAGLTYTDRTRLVDSLRARAAATKEAELSAKYAALATSVAYDRTSLRSRSARVKLAEAIGTLDERAGLLKHYDRDLEDPIRAVFNTTKIAAADDIDLGGGTVVSAASLAALPPTFFSDLFGPDIVKEIAPAGQVDPAALQQVVVTFPADMKQQLAQALKSSGVPMARM